MDEEPPAEPGTYDDEPERRSPLPWILGAIGALAIAGLAGWGIWAAVDDDDDDDSEVAGAQSAVIEIDDGFSEGQLALAVGDAVDLTNEGDDDCRLTANGAPLGTIGGGDSLTLSTEQTGVYLIQCEGVDDILELTVE
jgi:hypothetical protein